MKILFTFPTVALADLQQGFNQACEAADHIGSVFGLQERSGSRVALGSTKRSLQESGCGVSYSEDTRILPAEDLVKRYGCICDITSHGTTGPLFVDSNGATVAVFQNWAESGLASYVYDGECKQLTTASVTDCEDGAFVLRAKEKVTKLCKGRVKVTYDDRDRLYQKYFLTANDGNQGLIISVLDIEADKCWKKAGYEDGYPKGGPDANQDLYRQDLDLGEEGQCDSTEVQSGLPEAIGTYFGDNFANFIRIFVPLLMLVLVIVLFILCCWQWWPCCRCIRCCQRERGNASRVVRIVVLVSYVAVGGCVFGVAALGLGGNSLIVNGMQSLGCEAATLVASSLEDALIPSIEWIEDFTKILDDRSEGSFLYRLEEILTNTKDLELAMSNLLGVIDLTADIMASKQLLAPGTTQFPQVYVSDAATSGIYHSCEVCKTLATQLTAVSTELESSLAGALANVVEEVKAQLQGDALDNLRCSMQAATAPVGSLKNVIRDQLGLFVDGGVQGAIDMAGQYITLGVVVLVSLIAPVLLFGFVAVLLCVLKSKNEAREKNGENPYTPWTGRFACTGCCVAFLISAILFLAAGACSLGFFAFGSLCDLLIAFDADLAMKYDPIFNITGGDPLTREMFTAFLGTCLGTLENGNEYDEATADEKKYGKVVYENDAKLFNVVKVRVCDPSLYASDARNTWYETAYPLADYPRCRTFVQQEACKKYLQDNPGLSCPSAPTDKDAEGFCPIFQNELPRSASSPCVSEQKTVSMAEQLRSQVTTALDAVFEALPATGDSLPATADQPAFKALLELLKIPIKSIYVGLGADNPTNLVTSLQENTLFGGIGLARGRDRETVENEGDYFVLKESMLSGLLSGLDCADYPDADPFDSNVAEQEPLAEITNALQLGGKFRGWKVLSNHVVDFWPDPTPGDSFPVRGNGPHTGYVSYNGTGSYDRQSCTGAIADLANIECNLDSWVASTNLTSESAEYQFYTQVVGLAQQWAATDGPYVTKYGGSESDRGTIETAINNAVTELGKIGESFPYSSTDLENALRIIWGTDKEKFAIHPCQAGKNLLKLKTHLDSYSTTCNQVAAGDQAALDTELNKGCFLCDIFEKDSAECDPYDCVWVHADNSPETPCTPGQVDSGTPPVDRECICSKCGIDDPTQGIVVKPKRKVCDWDDLNTYWGKISGRFLSAAIELDREVGNIETRIRTDLKGLIDEFIILRITTFFEEQKCDFMGRAWYGMIDGLCYQIAVGLADISVAFTASGFLCIVLIALLWPIWRFTRDNINMWEKNINNGGHIAVN